MRSISIKQLHDRTGHWVRRAHGEGEVIVTERGTPVARILPPSQAARANPFATRKLLRGVAKLIGRPLGGTDTTAVIYKMREGR